MRSTAAQAAVPTPDGIELAGPIVWPSTSRTAVYESAREAAFRNRHFLNAYKKHARRTHRADADAVALIEVWNPTTLPDSKPQDRQRFWSLHAKLKADDTMQDPCVRMILATSDSSMEGRGEIMEKALRDFESAGYPVVIRLWATLCLLGERKGRTASPPDELGDSALDLLRRAVQERAFGPEDEVLVAERFVDNWAFFFRAHPEEVCTIFAEGGPVFKWTSLVLEGERQIALAWAARGVGYANTVTDDGLRGFHTGLGKARAALNEAWRMHPDRAQAAARMVYVAMGESEPREMRKWFDRTTSVRADHFGAWTNMRFGLFPRWHGSHEAVLKLGIEAVNTRRFDTRVPEQLYYAICDVERDMGLPKGKHIYGRADVWPHLRRMYEGYIAETGPAAAPWRDGWRSAYACVAFIAEDYATARRQLEAVDWKPSPGDHPEWHIDLSLMPLEVAARTGSQAELAARAETAWDRGDAAGAKELFEKLAKASNDDRTREFAHRRLEAAEKTGR
jgi:hypothetical protein